MSWDIWMEIDVGGADPVDLGYDRNVTWNLSPMYRLAFGGLLKDGIKDLDRMTGEQAKPFLRSAIQRMEDDPTPYKALNPDNGWGDYEGAVETLRAVLTWCVAAPKATLRVH